MKHGKLYLSPGVVAGTYRELLEKGVKNRVAPRIMKRDASVFTSDKALKKVVANRLGWVDVATAMKRQIPAIERFGAEVLKSGIRQVVLVGMGGSSLCPEVFKLVFEKHPKLTSFDVLDSTDPTAIRDLERTLDLKKTLFIVASKSGGTVETRSHEAYFLERLKRIGVANPGKHFVAITDKGSSLEQFAHEHKYRKIFVNPSDIGGRYSALSYFGLVPGFFAGVNLRELIGQAVVMEKMIRERNDETNPALSVAAYMVAAWQGGRDKLTFLGSPTLGPFVPWVEQLVAESTGKEGKGIIPIEGEPMGKTEQYGTDRALVVMRMAEEGSRNCTALKQGMQAGNVPVIEIALESPYELGQQLLLWEAATAIAGYFLEINPFDEPNVTESKDNTKKILNAFQLIKGMHPKKQIASTGQLTLLALDEAVPHDYSGEHGMEAILKRFFAELESPHYLATLCYFKSDRSTERELAAFRLMMREKVGLATLRGYGPRFLHSIGQLYKGGAATGHFVVFVRGSYRKLRIPGQSFDFGQLICAQALGDTQALSGRKLPVLLVSIDGSVAKGLKAFREMVASLLQAERQ